MPDSQKQSGNSQTLFVELSELNFEVAEQSAGLATAIRFELLNPSIKIGDVIVVLDGPDIKFHGMIRFIDEKGWAIAVDRHGSSVLASLQ